MVAERDEYHDSSEFQIQESSFNYYDTDFAKMKLDPTKARVWPCGYNASVL